MSVQKTIELLTQLDKLKEKYSAIFEEVITAYIVNNLAIEDDVSCSYNGSYPCLCGGVLVVKIKDAHYEMGINSGGTCYIDDRGNEIVSSGMWTVNYPDNFPEKYKKVVHEWVNDNVTWGCCGGCI